MPTDHLVRMAIANPKEGMRISIAFSRMKDYVLAAETQMARIWGRLEEAFARAQLVHTQMEEMAHGLKEARTEAQSPEIEMERIRQVVERAQTETDDGGWITPHRQAFTDMHFYLICWDSVGKMMRLVARCGLPGVRAVCHRHRVVIERYRQARHHLEHFDERLPGGKRVNSMSMPGDLGNLWGGMYSFGGENWDISPASLELLRGIVSEVESQLRSSAIAAIEAQDRSAQASPG